MEKHYLYAKFGFKNILDAEFVKLDEETSAELKQDAKCSVPTCDNTKLACPDKAFFMFPLEEMR